MTRISIVSSFLRLRREIRFHQQTMDNRAAAMRNFLRRAKKLDGGTPFDQASAAAYRARHANIEPHWYIALDHRRQLGRELLDLAPQFDAATTFEQRLELLNVNVADRADIAPGAGAVMIFAGYLREDSATRRGEDYCSGPLFAATQLEIIITMASTAEARAATDKVMVDVFGAQAYSLFGQRPDLQLVSTSTSTTPTTGD